MDWMARKQERVSPSLLLLPRASGTFHQPGTKVADTKQFKFNIIDTPGHVDFYRRGRTFPACTRWFAGSVLRRIRCRASVETVWRQANRYRVPRIGFVNKMDRSGADFLNVVKQVKEMLGAKAVPLQLPIGAGR